MPEDKGYGKNSKAPMTDTDIEAGKKAGEAAKKATEKERKSIKKKLDKKAVDDEFKSIEEMKAYGDKRFDEIEDAKKKK